MRDSASVVVIGGGILGMCTAFYLVEAGIRDVTIVESATLGSGSTALAAGVIRTWHSDPVWSHLAADSWDFYSQWQVVRGERLVADVRLVVVASGEGGGGRGPYRTGEHESCTEVPARRARPTAVVCALARHLRQRGVQVAEGVRATRIHEVGGQVRAVDTTAGTIGCDTCVVTCGPTPHDLLGTVGGAWIAGVLRGMPVPMVSLSGDCRADVPLLLDMTNRLYLAPDGDSWLASMPPRPYRHLASDPAPAWRDEVRAIVHAAHSRISGGAGRPVVTSVRRGVYDETPDGRPLVGRLSTLDGCLVATGLSGSGFQVAPALGRHLARQVWRSDPSGDGWDRALRPDRFS